MNLVIIFCAKYLYLFVLALAGYCALQLSREKKREFALFALCTLPLIYLVALVAGYVYYDPRPFVVGHFTPLIPHGPDNGFPSDHTLLLSGVTVVIAPFVRRASVLLWPLVFLGGFARVLTGVHHSIDILASIVISVVVGFFVYSALSKRGLLRSS